MEPYELKEARKSLGISAKAMAQELGISESTVYRLEAGPKSVPKHIELAVEAPIKRNDEYHDESGATSNTHVTESPIVNQNDSETLTTVPQENFHSICDRCWEEKDRPIISRVVCPKQICCFRGNQTTSGSFLRVRSDIPKFCHHEWANRRRKIKDIIIVGALKKS
jgi:DNA-binding XRE family transcriptional regulator